MPDLREFLVLTTKGLGIDAVEPLAEEAFTGIRLYVQTLAVGKERIFDLVHPIEVGQLGILEEAGQTRIGLQNQSDEIVVEVEKGLLSVSL